MKLPRFGRTPSLSALMDPSAYPESWLFPMDERWLRQFRKDVRRARSLGMRDGVFAKVGDSNTLAYNAFYGLGCREPVWGEHADLEPVMRRYREIELPPGADVDFSHCPDARDRRPWNSFSRVPAAAMMGIIAVHLARPPEELGELPHWWREDGERRPGESALETELRITRPLFALIQIGTNGYNYGLSPQLSADALADLVERVRRLGSVPVVFNIPPQLDHEAVPGRWEFGRQTAERIALAAAEARAPFVNLWLPLASGEFVNHGLIEHDGVIFDGFHLDTFGGYDGPEAVGRAVDFRPQALRHGANFRNLLVLKVLQELNSLAGDIGQE